MAGIPTYSAQGKSRSAIAIGFEGSPSNMEISLHDVNHLVVAPNSYGP